MSRTLLDEKFAAFAEPRDAAFGALADTSLAELWTKPAPAKWSRGESLLHLVRTMAFMRVFSAWARPATLLLSMVRFSKEYPTELEDFYPQIHGRLKSPRIMAGDVESVPLHRQGLHELRQGLERETRQLKAVTMCYDDDTAGYVRFIHPLKGIINFHQTLDFLRNHEGHHYRIIARDTETLSSSR